MVQGKDVCAMELDFKAIGKRIKIARIKKNFTQEAVADRIGVSPQHVSNIETGNSSVSLPTLVAIANMLSVSVDELWSYVKKKYKLNTTNFLFLCNC